MGRRIILIVAALSVALVAGAIVYVAPIWREISMMCSEDPAVWEEAIGAFVAADANAPPAAGSILFVGSSTIRLWESLAEDMAPLPVFRRGFGGAKVNDVLVYADRLIAPHRPAAVAVFVGSNDVSSRICNEAKSAERIAEDTGELVDRIHEFLPGTPVYYLAIKPSFRNDDDLVAANAVNTRIRGLAGVDDDLYFIDANAPIIGADGRVRPELLERDGIHLNRQGYRLWAPIIRDRLLADADGWNSN